MTTARLHPTPSDSARRSLWNCRLDLSLLGLGGLVRLGGLFGLGRGLVIAALILSVVEPVLISFDVELMNSLKQGSVTYGMLMGQNAMDFLGVRGTINDIVASASRLLT